MEATKSSLIAAVKDPSHPRWEEFYRVYFPVVVAVGRRQGLTSAEAEDLAQHVMVRLVAELSRLQYDPNRGRFRDWLIRLTIHQAANFRRKTANRQRLTKRAEENLSLPLPNDAARADTLLLEKERMLWSTALVEALVEGYLKSKALRPPTPEIVRALFLDEKEDATIEAEHGVSQGNIAVIRSRARSWMQKAYQNQMAEWLPGEEPPSAILTATEPTTA